MKKTILGLSALSLFLAGGSALALVPLEKPVKTIDPAVFKAITEAKCEKIQAKIDEQLEKMEQYKESHMQAYGNLTDRLEALAEKLKLKGYDAVELEADIKVLEGKVQDFSDQYAACKAKIEEMKGRDCAGDYAGFKSKVKENRQCLKEVHQASKAIRDYYFTEIKPDIKAIRTQDVEAAE